MANENNASMRPRLNVWEVEHSGRRRQEFHRASMRPRLNVWEVWSDLVSVVSAAINASMRPRLNVWEVKGRLDGGGVAYVAGFNEAQTQRLGSSRGKSKHRQRPCCFNEAQTQRLGSSARSDALDRLTAVLQ